MNNEISQNKIIQPTFPEESALIIEKILEKYDLAHKQKEKIKEFLNSDSLINFDDLPGNKLAKIAKDYGEQKISLKDVPAIIKEKLKLSIKEAEEMAEDLEKSLLIFIKQVLIKKEKINKWQGVVSEKEPKLNESKKSEKSSNKDAYREPIE